MAVTTTGENNSGVLTGAATQDEIRTATGSETHYVTLRNYSGSDVEVIFFINGTTDPDDVEIKYTIPTLETRVFVFLLGNAEVLYCEADSASAIRWFDGMDSI